MYDDYKEFGWEFVREFYMRDGVRPKWFEYLKTIDRLVIEIHKEQGASKSFKEKVHSKASGGRKNVPTKSPASHKTVIRNVQLPKGAEGETF